MTKTRNKIDNYPKRVGPFRVDESTYNTFQKIQRDTSKSANQVFRDMFKRTEIVILPKKDRSEIDLIRRLLLYENNLNQIAKNFNILQIKAHTAPGITTEFNQLYSELKGIIHKNLNDLATK